MSKLAVVMKELGSKLGLEEDVRLDDNGACVLMIDGEMVTAQWQEESAAALVYALVWSEVGDAPDARLLQFFLEANLFGLGTEGLYLGLHAPTLSYLVSCRLGERDLTADRLGDVFALMADMAVLWRAKAQKHLEDLESASDAGQLAPEAIRC